MALKSFAGVASMDCLSNTLTHTSFAKEPCAQQCTSADSKHYNSDTTPFQGLLLLLLLIPVNCLYRISGRSVLLPFLPANIII